MSFRLEQPEEGVQVALAAYLRGAAARGAEFRDPPSLLAPIDSRRLVQLYDEARATVEEKITRYHDLRAEVDHRINSALG
jgi:hypothetical protein